MNAIYTNQSTRENLDLLYAQARVYDRVKNWNRLNFLFSIIVPLLLSLVTVYNRSRGFVDSELLSSLLGLYGLLVLTFNIAISGHISALRRKAASIQEMYDCRVLGIRRNELKVEEIPRDDIIRAAAYSETVRKKHESDLVKRDGTSIRCMTRRRQWRSCATEKPRLGQIAKGGAARVLSFSIHCLACRDACLRHRHEIWAE
jgi:hypothetical protein